MKMTPPEIRPNFPQSPFLLSMDSYEDLAGLSHLSTEEVGVSGFLRDQIQPSGQ
jgi:hypothetical protein